MLENFITDTPTDRFATAPYMKVESKHYVVGLGNTGSWLSLLLGKAGMDVTIYDHDLVDIVNLGTQVYENKDLNRSKVESILSRVDRNKVTGRRQKFTDTSTKDIQKGIEGLDNTSAIFIYSMVDTMKSRKDIFKLVHGLVFNYEIQNKDSSTIPLVYIIDPRTSPEDSMIYCVNMLNTKEASKYENTLYSDEEANSEACGYRASPHMGMQVASFCATLAFNVLANMLEENTRFVPFKSIINLPFLMHSYE